MVMTIFEIGDQKETANSVNLENSSVIIQDCLWRFGWLSNFGEALCFCGQFYEIPIRSD